MYDTPRAAFVQTMGHKTAEHVLTYGTEQEQADRDILEHLGRSFISAADAEGWTTRIGLAETQTTVGQQRRLVADVVRAALVVIARRRYIAARGL